MADDFDFADDPAVGVPDGTVEDNGAPSTYLPPAEEDDYVSSNRTQPCWPLFGPLSRGLPFWKCLTRVAVAVVVGLAAHACGAPYCSCLLLGRLTMVASRTQTGVSQGKPACEPNAEVGPGFSGRD